MSKLLWVSILPGESGEKVISRFPAKSANADDVDCDTHTLDA